MIDVRVRKFNHATTLILYHAWPMLAIMRQTLIQNADVPQDKPTDVVIQTFSPLDDNLCICDQHDRIAYIIVI